MINTVTSQSIAPCLLASEAFDLAAHGTVGASVDDEEVQGVVLPGRNILPSA